MRSFESQVGVASSKQNQAFAIYQFQERCAVTPATSRSDILGGFRAIPVFRVDLSSSLRPRKHREQETKDKQKLTAGRIDFLPAFRNLPAVLCVPMLERNFNPCSLAVSRT